MVIKLPQVPSSVIKQSFSFAVSCIHCQLSEGLSCVNILYERRLIPLELMHVVCMWWHFGTGKGGKPIWKVVPLIG